MDQQTYTKAQLVDRIETAAEASGFPITQDAARFMVEALKSKGFSGKQIADAATECVLHGGRVLISTIIQKIEAEDGRPSDEEAWAIAFASLNDDDSILWNNEISAALREVMPLLSAGDDVAARMAFKGFYSRITSAARAKNEKPKWALSLGFDKEKREEVTQRAAALGFLSEDIKAELLPAPICEDSPAAALLEFHGESVVAVPSQLTKEDKEKGKAKMAELINKFGGGVKRG